MDTLCSLKCFCWLLSKPGTGLDPISSDESTIGPCPSGAGSEQRVGTVREACRVRRRSYAAALVQAEKAFSACNAKAERGEESLLLSWTVCSRNSREK